VITDSHDKFNPIPRMTPIGKDGLEPETRACGWWKAFKENVSAHGFKIEPEVFPAATDSRFVRKVGIPAFGFSPMKNCPILLHEHNEYIPVSTYLEGIKVYEDFLPGFINADVEGWEDCTEAA
jgi:hypothetical protein